MTIWRKSSYSNGEGGKCVELAEIPDGIAVRNSNRLDDGTVVFNRGPLGEMLRAIKAGDLDPLS